MRPWVLLFLCGCGSSYLGPRPGLFVSSERLPLVAGELPPGARPLVLSLPAVIRAAVLGDPRIRVALEAVEQARADHVTAGLLPNPTLSVSQSLNPLPWSVYDPKSRQGGPPQLDVGLSYSLDGILFGKRDASMKAAKLGVDVALASYADVARGHVLEAILAFHEVLLARELARLAAEGVASMERVRAITEQRVSAGGAGELELDRVRLALLVAGRRRLLADAELEASRSRLAARFSAPQGASLEVEGSLEVASPPSPPPLDAVLKLAAEHRPDLAARALRIDQARAEVQREERAALPELAVSVGYTRQFQAGSIGFPDVDAWGVGLQVTLPIFDRNQGNVARAKSALRQAGALAEAGRLDATSEIERALRSYVAAFESLRVFDAAALSSSAKALGRVELAYKEGGKTLLELLDAIAAHREVRRDHAVASADLLKALHSLNALAGTEVLSWRR